MKEVTAMIDQLLENIENIGTEVISLATSPGRVVAMNTFARIDIPHYAESLRDGFALHKNFFVAANGSACLSIHGEIAAGRRGDMQLTPQQVCRIMTGAEVPSSCVRVIPEEQGSVQGGSVYFSAEVLKSRRNYIRPRGGETKSGELLVSRGIVLSAGHLGQLAAAGVDSVTVYRRPKICFFCSGKELVASREQMKTGQKISSNHYLLSALITKFGGEFYDLGLVDDDVDSLKRLLTSTDLSAYDMVISTGGTGRGKYDLIERVLRDSGGEVLCTSLAMRPGKSLVMGRLGEAVFCGLPGPPAAVETLFYEIIGPLLLKIHGVSGVWPESIEAYMEHDFTVKSGNVVRIAGGVHRMEGGKCWTRTVRSREYSTCNLIVHPHQHRLSSGELVEIHLKSSPFCR